MTEFIKKQLIKIFDRVKRTRELILLFIITSVAVPNIIFLGVALFFRITRGQTLWFLTKGFFEIIYNFLIYFLSNTLINITPFLILSIIAVYTLGSYNLRNRRSKKYALIGVYLLISVLTILIDLVFYLDQLSKNPSSTGVLIFLSYHKYSMLLGSLGYGLGWIIGRLVDKIKSKA